MSNMIPYGAVTAHWADAGAVTDITEAMSAVLINNDLRVPALTPPGRGHVTRIPTSLGTQVSPGAGVWDALLRSIDAASFSGTIVIQIATPAGGYGLLMPAQLSDPADGGMPLRFPPDNVIGAQYSFRQDSPAAYWIRDIVEIPANNASLAHPEGEDIGMLITTAGMGTIGSHAGNFAVGARVLAGQDAHPNVVVTAAATGWVFSVIDAHAVLGT